MSEGRPASTAARPVVTQQLTAHLNGGSKFSEMHYRIYADGEETGITRHRLTTGSSKYLVTCDELRHGEETFDVLEAKGVGAMDWILARISK